MICGGIVPTSQWSRHCSYRRPCPPPPPLRDPDDPPRASPEEDRPLEVARGAGCGPGALEPAEKILRGGEEEARGGSLRADGMTNGADDRSDTLDLPEPAAPREIACPRSRKFPRS